MEPAIRYERIDESRGTQNERITTQWETKLGKMIFYVTCATALWFFYWLNGIQCPC